MFMIWRKLHRLTENNSLTGNKNWCFSRSFTPILNFQTVSRNWELTDTHLIQWILNHGHSEQWG